MNEIKLTTYDYIFCKIKSTFSLHSFTFLRKGMLFSMVSRGWYTYNFPLPWNLAFIVEEIRIGISDQFSTSCCVPRGTVRLKWYCLIYNIPPWSALDNTGLQILTIYEISCYVLVVGVFAKSCVNNNMPRQLFEPFLETAVLGAVILQTCWPKSRRHFRLHDSIGNCELFSPHLILLEGRVS